MALDDVLVSESSLYAISDAIRAKLGVSTRYKPAEMGPAIKSISMAGLPEWTITGDMEKFNYRGRLDAVIPTFEGKLTTADITNLDDGFVNSKLERIPFSINFQQGEISYYSRTMSQSLFQGCDRLLELPDMSGSPHSTMSWLFNCELVRSIPDSWCDLNFYSANVDTSANSPKMASTFRNCYSLRSIPEGFLKKLYNSSTSTNSNNTMFDNCYALDEIVGFRGPNSSPSSNLLNHFYNLNHLKRFVFDMENGMPRVQNWGEQIVDLTQNTGYSSSPANFIGYNSGITPDKEVKDDATYQALKNDADWFTADVNYSRYNHDSAVETINSLPDCSAYIASSGKSMNTIKFTGASGANTDGGAINTLTEEEIAVATAKGWTVSLV